MTKQELIKTIIKKKDEYLRVYRMAVKKGLDIEAVYLNGLAEGFLECLELVKQLDEPNETCKVIERETDNFYAEFQTTRWECSECYESIWVNSKYRLPDNFCPNCGRRIVR